MTLDEEPPVKPATVSTPPPPAPPAPSGVPVIEFFDEPEEETGKDKESKKRVIGPKQLADIRRKMQEKLAAHRK